MPTAIKESWSQLVREGGSLVKAIFRESFFAVPSVFWGSLGFVLLPQPISPRDITRASSSARSLLFFMVQYPFFRKFFHTYDFPF